MRYRVVALAASALFAASGCAPEGARQATVDARALYADTQCQGLETPGARWLKSAADLARLHGALSGGGGRRVALPEVDFDKEAVLVLAMGSRPTAGYGLALAERSAVRDADGLEVRVDWREPAPGSMQAQVITYPCLLIAVPGDGYAQVRVVDAQGTLRFSFEPE